MTKSTKAVNWSDEMVASLTGRYQSGENLDNIAKDLGKSVAAVRGKLVSLGIYQKAEAKAVGGASQVRKGHLVRDIAKHMGVDVEKIESLEKARKEDLELVLAHLTAE